MKALKSNLVKLLEKYNIPLRNFIWKKVPKAKGIAPLKIDIFSWFKKKLTVEETLDNIIIESFSDLTRWQKTGIGTYVDTVTRAELQMNAEKYGLYINNVKQSDNVKLAFFGMLSLRVKLADNLDRNKLLELFKGYV